MQAIITDIEGTTTALSFVQDVLFPYARARIGQFVQAHHDDPKVAALLADARREAGTDLDEQAVIDQLIAWIDADKKVTPLKSLQGMIWKQGFEQGDFTGHVYADAVAGLRRWHARGIKLYVYSSGSVQAQKLLYGHSDAGDLTPLFSGYFDTAIGHKREVDSYRHILAEIGLPGDEVMFLSDIREELDAARAAGLHTTWLVRDGATEPAAAHRQVRSFDTILP